MFPITARLWQSGPYPGNASAFILLVQMGPSELSWCNPLSCRHTQLGSSGLESFRASYERLVSFATKNMNVGTLKIESTTHRIGARTGAWHQTRKTSRGQFKHPSFAKLNQTLTVNIDTRKPGLKGTRNCKEKKETQTAIEQQTLTSL